MTRKEIRNVWIIFALLVFGTLFLTGTVFSGIHFVDDHEMIRYSLRIREAGLFTCIGEALRQDFALRFRPLYTVTRICLSGILGYHYAAWSVLNGLVIITALCFGYRCAGKLGCRPFASLLFALIGMVGPQSVVWWKLGPQESAGTAIFLVGFWALLDWLENGGRKKERLAIVCFTMMSLYKESYIGLLPFVILYALSDDGRGQKYSLRGLWQTLKKRRFFIGWFLTLGAVEAGIIVFAVGTNKLGYVGLDSGMTLYQLKEVWLASLRDPLKWYAFWSIPMLLLLLPSLGKWREWLAGMAQAGAIMLPQFVFYSKSGLEERYILPWALGYAWFFVIAALRRGGLAEGKKIRRILYLICLCGLLAAHSKILLQEAQYHTYRGKCFQKVWEIVMENTDAGSNILAAYSPYTESNLTLTYWGMVQDRKNVYTWDEEEKSCRIDWGELAGRTAEVSQMDVILFYSPEHRHYCQEPSIELTDYDVRTIGTLVVCLRR